MSDNTIKYLSFKGLETYDDLIKAEIASSDAETLASAKEYADKAVANVSSSSHDHNNLYYTEDEIDEKIDEVSEAVADLSNTATTNYNESIIGLSIDGRTVTYIKGDGSSHTFETQDTNTEYFLATDEVTGLTKLYATVGNAEDGTMTQKAIKTELDKKVGVTIDNDNNVLVFTI